jgi:membrane-bound lytic murein transglycosylase B
VLRIVALLTVLLTGPALAQPVEPFGQFLRNFEVKAVAAGVSAATYRSATAGLTPDPNVPTLVETQPEFTTTMWDYLDTRVTASRIERGRAAIERNRALFAEVGRNTGVDPYVLGAIWGIETDFIAALQLLERNRMAPSELVGSWAGAIGHLQVNPSNVVAHGTDGDGDGRIDLHNSLPDALATSARFLRQLGYRPGLDWGFEVEVPAGFDYLLATREQMRPVSFFSDRGVHRVQGRAFNDPATPVFLYVPAGASGPKFLMTGNYLVLKGYNFSDSYAMSVAHLTDRLKGSGSFVTPWPRSEKFPNLSQRIAIQQALTSLGLYDGAIDGRIGPISQAAYARFQASRGTVADGFITLRSYEELVAAAR